MGSASDDDIDDNEGEADWEKVANFCWSCFYRLVLQVWKWLIKYCSIS